MPTPGITDLPARIASLPFAEREVARRIFDISVAAGELVVPQEMRAWVESTFGAVEAVQRQEIVRVTNRITLEGTLFNGLRASRPLDSRTDDTLSDEVAATRGDPFCEPLTRTTHDSFGRIRGEHSTTAANVAKYDAHHAVIVFDDHDPLDLTPHKVSDYLNVAARWHEEVIEADPTAIYPFVMWNCLWRAGGSIIHGHAQAVATSGSHYPKVERLRRDAESYRATHRSDYFRDFAAVHRSLGLDIPAFGETTAFAHLTPVKEKELVVIGGGLHDGSFTRTVGETLSRFVRDLGVRSFNVALLLPPAGETDEDWADFPAVARIVDRGETANRTSDIAAMELYAASVVASDPFEVARLMGDRSVTRNNRKRLTDLVSRRPDSDE